MQPKPQQLCQRRGHQRPACVGRWLAELRWYAESDCSNVLHGKALPAAAPTAAKAAEMRRQRFQMPAAVRASIELLDVKARVALTAFKDLYDQVAHFQPDQQLKAVSAVCASARCFVGDTLEPLMPNGGSDLDALSASLLEHCSVLMQHCAIDRLASNGRESHALRLRLSETAEALAALARQAILQLLAGLAEALLEGDQAGPAGCGQKLAELADLHALAGKGERFCDLIAQSGALEALLIISSSLSHAPDWPMALRTISIVCCTDETVRSFHQHNGLARMTSLLNYRESSEAVRAEAAGVIAQVSEPGLPARCQDLLLCALGPHTDRLIRALTRLCQQTSSTDIFLLATTALSNISLASPASHEYLNRHATVRVLVSACQQGKAASPQARDQVAAVLANAATSSGQAGALTRANAAELLLEFLSEPSVSPAGERLQQSAVTAVGRLAKDPSSARVLMELGAHRRLVQLCRQPEERRCSDSVLLASLAALRLLHDACGPAAFRRCDLAELVRPRLLGALASCSRLQESQCRS